MAVRWKCKSFRQRQKNCLYTLRRRREIRESGQNKEKQMTCRSSLRPILIIYIVELLVCYSRHGVSDLATTSIRDTLINRLPTIPDKHYCASVYVVALSGVATLNIALNMSYGKLAFLSNLSLTIKSSPKKKAHKSLVIQQNHHA
jgi:hypothetical protein